MEKSVKVCVTGGAGYIASYLVKILLERGYTVHATLRSLNDASKVGLLKGLAHAETRLKLFEADIYNPADFEAAIQGCAFVFHLATPSQHYAGNSQFKNSIEAAVGGVRIIVESCMRSNTVKRIIYTSSTGAAAPLKDDGSGYKDVMDENCWTPLNLTFGMFSEYLQSKTLAEKEVLGYNGKGIEVVSLALALIGGDTIQPSLSYSMGIVISQAINDGFKYKNLRVFEDTCSVVLLAHVQDVVEAHIFSMEHPHINGRFIVANSFLKSTKIASIIHKLLPHITIPPEMIEDTKREGIKWGATKLQELGFKYKFDAEKTIHDTIVCAKHFGKL